MKTLVTNVPAQSAGIQLRFQEGDQEPILIRLSYRDAADLQALLTKAIAQETLGATVSATRG